MRTLLQQRSLLTLASAEAVTTIGSWVTMMAVFSILVFDGGGGVAQASGVFLVALAPVLFLSPLAGAVADRFDRRAVMIVAQLASGAVVTALIFARQLWAMYALLALLSSVGTLMAPARQAAVPQLVPRDGLTRANALLAQVAGLIKIFAPLLAGGMIAVVSPHSAMVFDVITYVAAAALLTRLPTLPAPGAVPALDDGSSGVDVAERAPAPRAPSSAATSETSPPAGVLRTLADVPQLVLLFATTFMAVLVLTGFDVLSTVVTRDVLGGDASLFGVLVALVGTGSVVTTALLMMKGERSAPWRDLLLGLAVIALLPVGMALAGMVADPRLGVVLAAAGCLIGGLGNGAVMVQLPTLMQTLSPAAVLGRVGGVFQSTVVAGQLAAILATPLIVPARAGYVSYFLLMAVGLAAVALVSGLVLRRLGAAEAPSESDLARAEAKPGSVATEGLTATNVARDAVTENATGAAPALPRHELGGRDGPGATAPTSLASDFALDA